MTKKITTKFMQVGLVASFLIGNQAFSAISINEETKVAANQLGAKDLAEVGFSENSSVVSEEVKKDIAELISNAQKKGSISEVTVAAWSDQEYPSPNVKLSKSQRKLAEDRADGIAAHIKSQYSISDIHKLNMAKRPNEIQKILRTFQAHEKKTMEKTGMAPTNENQTGFLGLKGKASHAVVMIYYKN